MPYVQQIINNSAAFVDKLQAVLQPLEQIINKINDFLWTYPILILLIATHVYLTFKLKFIQKYLLKAMKLTLKKDNSTGMVSNFGALAVSLAATIGTGSILGMTTAVALGGPGAVLWVIIFGTLGIATKYSECLLAVKYRVRRKETREYVGGPMYIMRDILKLKWMGIFFAVCGLLMGLTGAGFLQVNSIVDLLNNAYHINGLLVGFVVISVVSIVTVGGVKGIAKVCEWLVPIMGSLYLIAAIYIFVIHYKQLPAAVMIIVKSAFGFKAGVGGFAGAALMAALQNGISRSVLATEAGMGSAAVVAAAAKTQNPVRQGLVASTSVFWAFFICTITGLVITVAGDWQSGTKFAADLCSDAFSKIPFIGEPLLILSLTIFSLTTMIGWAYYGEKFLEFLGGSKMIKYFRVFWVCFMFIGVYIAPSFAWAIVVLITALMAIPNLIMIFMLRKRIVKETELYLKSEIDNI